jgi:soluble calcium-activated nucleotidase 1
LESRQQQQQQRVAAPSTTGSVHNYDRRAYYSAKSKTSFDSVQLDVESGSNSNKNEGLSRRTNMQQNGGGISQSPSTSEGSLASLGSFATNGGGGAGPSSTARRPFLRSESIAYDPKRRAGSMSARVQFLLRQHFQAVVASLAFLAFVLVVTSDAVHDAPAAMMLRGSGGGGASPSQLEHWGGAVRGGSFRVEDAVIPPLTVNDVRSNRQFLFSAVTDLDQLSLVESERKPTFRSLLLPGMLTRTGERSYEIGFGSPRTLTTKHNEAGRGAEFSELTVYNNRLLTFDDRTGDVFEIINNKDGTQSEVVPRFVITEGDGDTDKGMKWEWATVKNGELYMGSMGKEYTRADGSIANENNLWIGILNGRGELRRENWKERYGVVRKALGAEAPGYIIMEAILWSDHLKKWVFLPRRISSQAYDEDRDEHMGGNKLVLVDEYFTNAKVVEITGMEVDGLRGFSSFAFVPGTKDRHALAIRSVEENCTGDMDVCKQRSYFLVFDVLTGEVLSTEERYPENMKFEGVEFVDMHTQTKM